MGRVFITKSITAHNSFSDPCKIVGAANFVLSGTWEATVHLQRSKDIGVTWDDVTDANGNVVTWTRNVTAIINGSTEGDSVLWRFGVKTSNFTSGTIVGEITQ